MYIAVIIQMCFRHYYWQTKFTQNGSYSRPQHLLLVQEFSTEFCEGLAVRLLVCPSVVQYSKGQSNNANSVALDR